MPDSSLSVTFSYIMNVDVLPPPPPSHLPEPLVGRP